MFKFIILCALVAVATAKPGFYASPLISTLVSEKTIESHGNSVVHASAPVVQPVLTYAAVKPAHHFVHQEPFYSAAYIAPTYYV